MSEPVSQTFEKMYKAHYELLRNSSENIIGDHDASHDIVQEVFVNLWHRKEDMVKILNPKAYLFRSVINASISYLEKNKHNVPFASLHLETNQRSDSAVLLKELEAKIQLALDQLPPKCKAVFVLSRFEELPNKEIASLLGLSLKTVENQMGIALKKMREQLHPYITKEIMLLAMSGAVSLLLQLLATSHTSTSLS